jgi:hypothetical protein
MALRNGLFRDLGSTRGWEWGSFPCHGQKIKKKFIKVSQSCLPTLPAYFPFESSFFCNLGASKVHQRTISPENTKTCWPDKILKKYGGDAVLIKTKKNKKKTLYWSLFLKMIREFDSIRSRSDNIVISTFTNNYLVLIKLQSSIFFSWYILRLVILSVGIILVHHGCSSGLLGPHPPSIHYIISTSQLNNILKQHLLLKKKKKSMYVTKWYKQSPLSRY